MEFANMAAVTRYPEELRLRLPRGMPEALSLAAGQHLTTPTEWARQALLRSLQAEGIRICDGKASVATQLPQGVCIVVSKRDAW
jgi:hypothetical protein